MRRADFKAICVWGILVFGLCAVIAARAAQQSFTISISTAQSSFKATREIRLQVIITNTSQQEIAVGNAGGEAAELSGYEIIVFDDKGNAPPETRYHKGVRREDPNIPVGTGSLVKVSLGPGQSLKDATILNRLYDLSKPGNYTIQVQRTDPETKTVVKSNIITLTITP